MACPSLLRSITSSFHGQLLTPSPSSSVKSPYRNRLNGCSVVSVRAAAKIALVEKSDAEKTHRLKVRYLETIVPLLTEEFKYTNVHQVPKVEKIVVNCGIGDAPQNAKGLEAAVNDMARITGQRPIKTRAKNSIATFKIREGQPLGVAVTLRRNIMYSFLDRLINLGLPRTQDFQGLNPNSFDGTGNYSIGIREQNVFPEISYDLGARRGMTVCIKTSTKTDQEAQRLLALMGMPFKEDVDTTEQLPRRKKLKRRHFDSKGRRI